MFRDAIVKSGLTQHEWSRRLGVSKGHLSQLVSGSKKPSLDLALRIAAMTDGAVPVESWARPAASEDAA